MRLIYYRKRRAHDDGFGKYPLAAEECASCCVPGHRAALKDCARCKLVAYCSKSCQTEHWKVIHKKLCVPVAERKPHAAAAVAAAAAAVAELCNANDDHCSICQKCCPPQPRPR